MKSIFLAAAIAASAYLEVNAIPLAAVNANANVQVGNGGNSNAADIAAKVNLNNLNGNAIPVSPSTVKANVNLGNNNNNLADVDAKVNLGKAVKAKANVKLDPDVDVNAKVNALKGDNDDNLVDAKVKLGNVADVKAKVGSNNGNLVDAKVNVGGSNDHLANVKANVNLGNDPKNQGNINGDVKALHNSIPANAHQNNASPLINVDLGKPDPNSGLNVGNLLHLGLGGDSDPTHDLDPSKNNKGKDFNKGSNIRLGKPSPKKGNPQQHNGDGSLLDVDLDNPLIDGDVNVGNLAHVGLNNHGSDPKHGGNDYLGNNNNKGNNNKGNDNKGNNDKGHNQFKPGHSNAKLQNGAGQSGDNDPLLDVGLNTGILSGVAADVGVGNIAHVAVNNDDHDHSGHANGKGNQNKDKNDKNFHPSQSGKLGQHKNKQNNNDNDDDNSLLDLGYGVGSLLGVHAGIGGNGNNDGHNSQQHKNHPQNTKSHNDNHNNQPKQGHHQGEKGFQGKSSGKLGKPNQKQHDDKKDKCGPGYHLDPHTKSCEKTDSLGRHQKHGGVNPNSAGKCPVDYQKHPFLNLCFSSSIDMHVELGISGPHHAHQSNGNCQGGWTQHPYLDQICIDSRVDFGLHVSPHDSRPDIYGACGQKYRHHSNILDLCINTTLDVDLGNSRIGRMINEDEVCTAGWRKHPDVANLCVDSSVNLGLFDTDRPTGHDGSCPESHVVHPTVLDLCIEAKIAASLAHQRPMVSIPAASDDKSAPSNKVKSSTSNENNSGIHIDANTSILGLAHNVGAHVGLGQLL